MNTHAYSQIQIRKFLKVLIPTILLSCPLVAQNASAQKALTSAWEDVHVKKEAPVPSTPGIGMNHVKFEDGFKFLFRLMHSINVDGRGGQIETTQNQGKTSQEFIAGFSVKGALLHEVQIVDEKQAQLWTKYLRDSGAQWVRYSINVSPQDPSYHIVVTAASLANMNRHNAEIGNNLGTGDPGDASIFSVGDQIDVATIEWDKRYSFKDIMLFKFNLGHLVLRYPFMSNDEYTYLAVRAEGDVGFETIRKYNENGPWTSFSHMGGDDPSVITDGSQPTTGQPENVAVFGASYSGGLEFNVRNKRHDININLQSNWRSGGYGGGSQNGGGAIVDPVIIQQNQNLYNTYQPQLASYNSAMTDYTAYQNTLNAWNTAKAADIALFPADASLSDADLSIKLNKPIPGTAPTQPTAPKAPTYENNVVHAMHTYGYFDQVLKVNIPMRGFGALKRAWGLEIGAKYSIQMYDEIRGGTVVIPLQQRAIATGYIGVNF